MKCHKTEKGKDEKRKKDGRREEAGRMKIGYSNGIQITASQKIVGGPPIQYRRDRQTDRQTDRQDKTGWIREQHPKVTIC